MRPWAPALLGLPLLSGCFANSPPPQNDANSPPALIGQLRKEYDYCVYTSAGKQIRAGGHDPAYVSEVAFSSCTTEEQAIYSVLYSTGMQPNVATTAVVGVKLQLKRTIRDMMENPAKHAPKT